MYGLIKENGGSTFLFDLEQAVSVIFSFFWGCCGANAEERQGVLIQV